MMTPMTRRAVLGHAAGGAGTCVWRPPPRWPPASPPPRPPLARSSKAESITRSANGVIRKSP